MNVYYSDCTFYLAPYPGNGYVHWLLFFFTGLIHLPVLYCQLYGNKLRDILEQVSTRFRSNFGSALLIFLITGTYLMVANQSYLGLGNFFGNPWSVLIVLKLDPRRSVILLTSIAQAG